MKRHLIPVPVLGFWFLGTGVLLIFASLFPQKNALTKALFWLSTGMPRIGSMTDKTWVMINGIAMLLMGLVFFAFWAFGNPAGPTP
jgi:hypothetical protein